MKTFKHVQQSLVVYGFDKNYMFNVFPENKEKAEKEVKFFVKRLREVVSGTFFDALKNEVNKY